MSQPDNDTVDYDGPGGGQSTKTVGTNPRNPSSSALSLKSSVLAPNLVWFHDADLAFDTALADGRLSMDELAPNFVGNYMYMGTTIDGDLFKQIMTREYLPFTGAPNPTKT